MFRNSMHETSGGHLSVHLTPVPLELTTGEPLPGEDPCDARSWVQRLSDRIAPVQSGDLSRLDLADGRSDLSGAVDAVRADMAEDGATDPGPYLDPMALADFGVTRAQVLAAFGRRD
ncbi:hypothetical protein DDP54_15585 (plasmid) [Cellulomonas sp. WB94]|uniref:hypothetical protein n=1 Tax=Cellulomonas sp. WB94 TaxID=2173174 RepID=UPI000D58590C|nr:hypothetical protein [Cellulomonas sp. WB94]PVU81321.1 hypothetical protein DDP54_15585 [Cellulomonas sp. WB94]